VLSEPNYIPSAADLATAVAAFADPVIEFAAGVPRKKLALTFERFPDRGLFRFGEQLVLLGGLFLAASYVDAALRNGDVSGDHYRDFLSTILFGRGYNRGVACALFQKAAQVNGGGIASLIRDDRVITAFAQSRRRTASNTFRARIARPLESDVAAVIEQVRFFSDVSLGDDGKVLFRGSPMNLWPFLRWDGQTLLRIRGVKRRMPNGMPESMEWVDGGGTQSEVADLTFQQQSELKRVGILIGHPIKRRPLRIDIPQNESVVPLLADSHPQMSDLAELLREKADDKTIAEKWILPFLRAERGNQITLDDAYEEIRNTVVVDNAIIRRCLEADPITVLTEYLVSEPHDTMDCLLRLTTGVEAQAIYAAIQQQTAKLTNRLRPMYPFDEHDATLEERLKEYRAGLAARAIAGLLKFRIVEQHAHEAIDDYIQRVESFAEYAADPQAETSKIAQGFLQCGNLIHAAARFVIQFYTALTFYDPRRQDGISERRRSELAAEVKRTGRLPFAKVISEFRKLGENDAITSKVEEHLGRELWDRRRCWALVDFLNSFRLARNEVAHDSLPTGLDVTHYISGVIAFLKWLQCPTADDTHRQRIYPAVLHLNVITMNQCGITSVRYGLTERPTSGGRAAVGPITLYTQQPLAHFAGVFYGLPNHDKSQRALWIDPVLIPTNVFSVPK
jgi:hypothetical protein